MTTVFSSVKEACIAVLSGAVDPVRVTSSQRASCPTIDTHRAISRVRGGSSGLSRSLVKGEQLEWNVIVQIADDECIDRNDIDIGALSEEDLCRLKTDDPFLYYSIPAMKRRSYLCDKINDDDAIKSSTSRRSSLPSYRMSRQDALYQEVHEDTRRRESIVRRSSRLSTEAHPSLIFEEMMLLELQQLDEGDDTDSEMDFSFTADDLVQLISELDDQ